MLRHMHRGIKYGKKLTFNLWGLVAIVVSTSLVGYWIISTMAATQQYSWEAENGQLNAQVKKITDSKASGSSAIEFSTSSGDIPTVSANKAGWNIYDFQSGDISVRSAIRRQKPAFVRWFFSLDRYVRDETTIDKRLRDYEGYFKKADFQDFLSALKENQTTLIVTNSMKDKWYTEYSACSGCNYPDMAKYTPYVDKVEAILKESGVKVIWEPFNEPDLRWGAINATLPSAGATENFATSWKPFDDISKGWANWSGGYGELWAQMHSLTDFTQASGGIVTKYVNEVPLTERWKPYSNFVQSTKWREATALHVDLASFHIYRNNYTSGYAPTAVADYVNRIAEEITNWSNIKGSPMKFYIGEIGPNSGINKGIISNDEAKYLRDVHSALMTDQRTKDLYMGMTAHIFAENDTQIAPWQTTKGWWEPDFDINNLVR